MKRALSGIAFKTYSRRLGFSKEAIDKLTHIRSAPPTRTPKSNKGNVAVWYPSKKMGFIVKAESHKVEFAQVLEAEHDEEVLEYYDQPPPIPLEYLDTHNRLRNVLYTPDYFIFRYGSAGWVECKPTQELIRQAQRRPGRIQMDKRGKTVYDLKVAREGTRAAYPFKNYYRSKEKTVSRHGDYAWAMGHIDHLEVDLELLDSKTRKLLGKCWLTLLILAHPRRIAAFYLSPRNQLPDHRVGGHAGYPLAENSGWRETENGAACG